MHWRTNSLVAHHSLWSMEVYSTYAVCVPVYKAYKKHKGVHVLIHWNRELCSETNNTTYVAIHSHFPFINSKKKQKKLQQNGIVSLLSAFLITSATTVPLDLNICTYSIMFYVCDLQHIAPPLTAHRIHKIQNRSVRKAKHKRSVVGGHLLRSVE